MPVAARFVTALLLVVTLTTPASAQTLVPDNDVPGVLVEQGYDLRLGVGGLDYPSGITFGGGRAWICEAGFPGVPPTVKEVTFSATGTGTARVILTPMMLPPGRLAPPFTNVTYRDGQIWLAHLQAGANGWMVGAVSRFNPDDPTGTFTTVLTNLPSTGDHQNNTIVFGADGRGYFGQGTATNSSVVGPDNRWIGDAPGFREYAPVQIVLNGDSFKSRVPTPADPNAQAVTAPYRPFASGDIAPGFVVAAATPTAPQDGGIIAGTGAVYSFDPAAADPLRSLRLEAWGLRNPFGLTFDAQDPTRLFVSNNGSDIRGRAGDPNQPFNPATYVKTGSHPIAGDEDDLFVVTVGGAVEFFGWPDFFHDPATRQPLSVGDPRFCQSPVLAPSDCPRPLFDEAFRNSLVVEPLFATAGQFVSVTGLEPSTSDAFGYRGQLFVTESGSYGPQTGAFTFTGYKLLRVDRASGATVEFVVNQGSTADELLDPAKLNKPVSVAFTGDELAIVDLGVIEPGINLFQSGTGKVWLLRNTRVTAGEAAPDAEALSLGAVRPNPAAGAATVSFRLASAATVRLAVFDVLGREVRVVAQGARAAGAYTETVPTAGLPAGVYVVRLDADGRAESRRFTVAR